MKFIKVSLFLSGILLISAIAFAGPQIELPNSNFNFGKIVQHASVSHSFWIKSTGDEDLVITKIVPGCGCTKIPIIDTVIAPGDSVALEIVFSTKSFRGFVSKKPYLETNIGDRKYYLRFDSELMPDPETQFTPLKITPFKIDVSQFTVKTRRKAKFEIENNSDEDFKVSILDIDGKKFTVEIPKIIKAGEKITGMLEVLESEVGSEFDQSFTFELNDNPAFRYTIPVRRIIRSLDNK